MKQQELREAITFNRYGGKRTTVSVGISNHQVLLEFTNDDCTVVHGLSRNAAEDIASAIARAAEEIDYELSELASGDDDEEEPECEDCDCTHVIIKKVSHA